jgi:phosphoglycolate phosphatase
MTVDDATKHKPDPEMVRKICSTLNVPPGRTVMVGDTPADFIMGKRAGVAASVALAPRAKGEVAALADTVISSYEEVSILDSPSNRKIV